MIAEAVSCVFWLPIDIIKERLQVQNVMKTGYGYKNSFDAYRKIV
jgi:inorganic pyrophosphatase/solute carrier family 25 iron transporter 28/37